MKTNWLICTAALVVACQGSGHIGLVGAPSDASPSVSDSGWHDEAAAGDDNDEICDNDLDDDGDREVDEHCGCNPSTEPSKACYPGLPATRNVGACADGIQRCTPSGEFSHWGPCDGAVVPRIEVCDGVDNDCNGKIDDAPGCACGLGDEEACYTGPPETRGQGRCKDGQHRCNSDGTGWGDCIGEVKPIDELCGDGIDNDCDGQIDEGECLCSAGQTEPCYTGPAGTRNTGQCRDGKRSCASDGAWSDCLAEVTPAAERCHDGIDNDCDGQVDEGCVVTVDVNIVGDCVWAFCPANAPYPVGCNITMWGDDCRGCVATSGTGGVYFQEGNNCGKGWVQGQLYCSSTPANGLDRSNCTVNKGLTYYPSSPSGCPALGTGDC